MKSILKVILTGMFCAVALLSSVRPAAASSLTFDVIVNTTPLIGSSSAPFWLDFQLNGAGTPALHNEVSITNFQFFGGSAVVSATSPTRIGGVTGDMTAGIAMDDSTNFFNEFYQQFNPGSSLKFTVNMTTNLLTPTPDVFSFAILDKDLFNIPTTGLGDSLLLFDIKPNPKLSDLRGFRGADGSGFSAVTAQAVPEPASLTLLGLGLAGIAVRRLRGRTARS